MANPPKKSPNLLSTLLKGTVIKHIWWQIIVVCVYSAVVVAIYVSVPSWYGVEVKISLIEILGVVTGLLLVFRTQIAYDRYWEGRKVWTDIGSTVGTLARLIWISVKAEEGKDVVEKKTVMNLLAAFPLATKHYLRNEYAQDFEDVKAYLTTFPEPLLRQGGAGGKGGASAVPDFVSPSNTPGEITYYLGAYLDRITERRMVDREVMRLLQSSVSMLGDCLCGLDKILRTPMPLAYSLHLEHCLYIYILALPVQLVYSAEWWTIPIVGIACFAILGILGIGAEIENPFGYDDNDLPLDDFCTDIINEIRLITNLQLPKSLEWMGAPKNYPMGPGSSLNARDLGEMGVDELYEMFRQQARISIKVGGGTGANDNPAMVITD